MIFPFFAATVKSGTWSIFKSEHAVLLRKIGAMSEVARKFDERSEVPKKGTEGISITHLLGNVDSSLSCSATIRMCFIRDVLP